MGVDVPPVCSLYHRSTPLSPPAASDVARAVAAAVCRHTPDVVVMDGVDTELEASIAAILSCRCALPKLPVSWNSSY